MEAIPVIQRAAFLGASIGSPEDRSKFEWEVNSYLADGWRLHTVHIYKPDEDKHGDVYDYNIILTREEEA